MDVPVHLRGVLLVHIHPDPGMLFAAGRVCGKAPRVDGFLDAGVEGVHGEVPALGHGAHDLSHAAELREIETGEHAADRLLGDLPEIRVLLGHGNILVHRVEQELRGVVAREDPAVAEGDLPVKAHQLLQEQRIDHQHSVEGLPTAPGGALPDGAHGLGGAGRVREGRKITQIERHLQRPLPHEQPVLVRSGVPRAVRKIVRVGAEAANRDFSVVRAHRAHGAHEAAGRARLGGGHRDNRIRPRLGGAQEVRKHLEGARQLPDPGGDRVQLRSAQLIGVGDRAHMRGGQGVVTGDLLLHGGVG